LNDLNALRIFAVHLRVSLSRVSIIIFIREEWRINWRGKEHWRGTYHVHNKEWQNLTSRWEVSVNSGISLSEFGCPECGAGYRMIIYDRNASEIVCTKCGLVLQERLECEHVSESPNDCTRNDEKPLCDLVEISMKLVGWDRNHASQFVMETLQVIAIGNLKERRIRQRHRSEEPCGGCIGLVLWMLNKSKGFDISFRQAEKLLGKSKSSIHRNYKFVDGLMKGKEEATVILCDSLSCRSCEYPQPMIPQRR